MKPLLLHLKQREIDVFRKAGVEAFDIVADLDRRAGAPVLEATLDALLQRLPVAVQENA